MNITFIFGESPWYGNDPGGVNYCDSEDIQGNVADGMGFLISITICVARGSGEMEVTRKE